MKNSIVWLCKSSCFTIKWVKIVSFFICFTLHWQHSLLISFAFAFITVNEITSWNICDNFKALWWVRKKVLYWVAFVLFSCVVFANNFEISHFINFERIFFNIQLFARDDRRSRYSSILSCLPKVTLMYKWSSKILRSFEDLFFCWQSEHFQVLEKIKTNKSQTDQRLMVIMDGSDSCIWGKMWRKECFGSNLTS